MTGFALSGVSGATAAASTTSSKGSGSGSGSASTSKLTENDFIQLIIAQLQNQNPISGGSGGGNSSQNLVSEFSDLATVSGIDQLNTQVSAFQSGAAATQLSQAAGLIGKEIATSGNSFTMPTSGPATGAFNLAAAAKSASVSIINPNGTLAATLSLGNLPSGLNQFTWAGGTAGQTYTYQVSAASAAGATVSATPYAVGQVSAVNLSGSAPTLSVTGGTTPIPLSNVISVLGG